MRQSEDHPWHPHNQDIIRERRRWRKIKDDELLAMYQQAIAGGVRISICPPGVKTEVNYWEVLEDPRYDHITGKVEPVIEEEA